MKTMTLIGAGRVGISLAYLWRKNNCVQIQQVLTQSTHSALIAAEKIGAGIACDTVNDITPADIFFLALPDDQIVQAAEKLASLNLLKSDTIVFHASGVLSSDILSHLPASVAKAHPVFSFVCFDYVVNHFAGAYCTLQGNEAALPVLAYLFESIGANIVAEAEIDPALYHCGLVFLSNFVLSLLSAGSDCLTRAGIDKAKAKKMVLPLIQSVLHQADAMDDWYNALTGPVSRGDSKTIQTHIARLGDSDPDVENLYRALGKTALTLASKQGLSAEQVRNINELLETEK